MCSDKRTLAPPPPQRHEQLTDDEHVSARIAQRAQRVVLVAAGGIPQAEVDRDTLNNGVCRVVVWRSGGVSEGYRVERGAWVVVDRTPDRGATTGAKPQHISHNSQLAKEKHLHKTYFLAAR